jgi:hypothetical protein
MNDPKPILYSYVRKSPPKQPPTFAAHDKATHDKGYLQGVVSTLVVVFVLYLLVRLGL